MRYAVVIEQAQNNYSAYVPDLPGCIATGQSIEQTGQNIREAIAFHLAGLRQDGLPIPLPITRCEYIQLDAPGPIARLRKALRTLLGLQARPRDPAEASPLRKTRGS